MFNIKRLLRSFKYAFQGLSEAVQTETNWKIGILEAIVVIAAGFYFKISKLDWILVIILIGIILSAELCNSAIEAIVDSFVDQEHPKAKIAKDFAAAQSVILIIASLVAGLMIFWPYFKNAF